MTDLKTKIKIERFILFHGYLNHLATLSTGAILIMAAFLENIFMQPEWKFLVVISISGFLFAIAFALFTQTFSLMGFRVPRKEEVPLREDILGSIFLILTWLCFLIGIGTLGFFVIKNLY